MNLIDKITPPSKLETDESSIYYNRDICRVEKINGVIMTTGNNMYEFIESYEVDGGFIRYDYRGKNFLMPLTKLEHIITDLQCFKLTYIEPRTGGTRVNSLVIHIDHKVEIVTFKKEDEVKLIDDRRGYSHSTTGHFSETLIGVEKLGSYDVPIEEDGNKISNYAPYLQKGIDILKKDINMSKLINKI